MTTQLQNLEHITTFDAFSEFMGNLTGGTTIDDTILKHGWRVATSVEDFFNLWCFASQETTVYAQSLEYLLRLGPEDFQTFLALLEQSVTDLEELIQLHKDMQQYGCKETSNQLFRVAITYAEDEKDIMLLLKMLEMDNPLRADVHGQAFALWNQQSKPADALIAD